MSKITYELSPKTVNGKSQIMVRFSVSRDKRFRLKSHIFVPRKRFIDGKIIIPRNYLKDYGDSVKAYNQFELFKQKMDMLIESDYIQLLSKETIIALVDATDMEENADIFSSKDLLDEAIQNVSTISEETTIYSYIDQYCEVKELSDTRKHSYLLMKREIAKFEKFRELFKLDGKGLTYPTLSCPDDIKTFKGYFQEEENLAVQYPLIYKKCVDFSMSLFPPKNKYNYYKTHHRTYNYLPSMMHRLRSVYRWIETCCNVQIDETLCPECDTYNEVYTDAFYLTKEERNTIDNLDFSDNPKLETQKDIFIFNCLTGCRYCDLQLLTEKNIHNGLLSYHPLKTRKLTNPVIPSIPLSHRALELIDKYRGIDKKNRLFPFKSLTYYNNSIKEIIRLAGITRYVYGSSDPTSKFYHRPLYELASSYTARKTFIGCAYKEVKSQNIISTMSGHASGSTSFCRYRTIDDEDRRELINLLDC